MTRSRKLAKLREELMKKEPVQEVSGLLLWLTGSAKSLLPGFAFTRIQINDGFKSQPHIDVGHEGASKIVGLGQYVGGQLWQHDCVGCVRGRCWNSEGYHGLILELAIGVWGVHGAGAVGTPSVSCPEKLWCCVVIRGGALAVGISSREPRRFPLFVSLASHVESN